LLPESVAASMSECASWRDHSGQPRAPPQPRTRASTRSLPSMPRAMDRRTAFAQTVAAPVGAADSPWIAARAAPRAVTTAAPRRAAIRMDGTKTVHQNLKDARVFQTLIAAAAATNCYGEGTPGSFTVFAPNDAAFARLRPGTLEALLKPENAEKLRHIIKYHVVPGPPRALKTLQGVGELCSDYGGSLPYFGSGNVVRVGGVLVIPDVSNVECSNGIVHTVDSVMVPPGIKPAGIDAGYIPPQTLGGSDSVIESFYTPRVIPSIEGARAVAASLPSTTGGRRAMGLQEQLPFWMYGPPYNAAVQTDYEPISAAAPEAYVDYQLMPEGSVVVEPDSFDANEINPISGMSKYIGKTQRLVEGSGLSDYADKTTSMD